jgi:predicted DNA-binding protein
MKPEKRHKTTVTVRLTEEESELLEHLCALKQTSRTKYLARLATSHAKQELLDYAAREYLEGKASFSALATKTGVDVPTIMEEVARRTGEDAQAVEGFLTAVKTLAQVHDNPEFYHLALKALT